MDLRQELFANQDLKYRDFHKKLVPNVDEDKIIGVRVPIMRKIAKQAYKENAQNKLEYYEELMVQGLVVGMKKCSVDEHIADLKEFVPMINSWGVCDSCSSACKFVKKDLSAYFDVIKAFNTGREYETRYAIVMLMDYYLVDDYIDEVLSILTSIESDYYYVNMALAWAYSFVYIKYPQKMISIFEQNTLPKFVQNTAIQKIRDSFRVEKADKDYLLKYKK